MLNVQKYLLENSKDIGISAALSKLDVEFGIVSKQYNDRVVLNYGITTTKKFHPICDECRGLILGYPDMSVVLARSFDRFYNYGEYPQETINDKFDINRSIVFDKIDGSLINIYYDGNKWCCATRKMAFAEGKTIRGNSYKSLVDDALGYMVEDIDKNIFSSLDDITVICELVSPENRVVVPYKEKQLYLLAIRDKNTGFYYNKYVIDETAKILGIKKPKVYKFNSFDEIIKSANGLEPMDENGEGYICYDPVTQFRIKIKNAAYLALHHLRDNGVVSDKRIACLVFDNDYAEYLNFFPEDKEFFDPFIDAYDNMLKDIKYVWNKTRWIESQKDFALQVKELSISGILFQLRKGMDLSKILENVSADKKLDLLNKYKGV